MTPLELVISNVVSKISASGFNFANNFLSREENKKPLKGFLKSKTESKKKQQKEEANDKHLKKINKESLDLGEESLRKIVTSLNPTNSLSLADGSKKKKKKFNQKGRN